MRTTRSSGEDERGTSEGDGGVTRMTRTEPAMTRTKIDDGGSGRSKLDLGEAEDDSDRSRSRHRAQLGEARAGSLVKMAREVHARGGCRR
jgi:hypothetical protein